MNKAQGPAQRRLEDIMVDELVHEPSRVRADERFEVGVAKLSTQHRGDFGRLSNMPFEALEALLDEGLELFREA